MFDKIIHMEYPEACLKILIENLEKEDYPVLQIMIQNIAVLYNQAPGENVAHTLQRLMDILKIVIFNISKIK